MSDLEEPILPPPTARVGNADLARRMDRMETRQDSVEAKVTDLATIVSRVEQNQQHAGELAKLRFDAVDMATKTIDNTLERFMGRINAIVSGEVKLPAQAEGERFLAAYSAWHDEVEDRFDHLDPSLQARVRALEDRALRGQGVVEVFGSGKTVLLVIAAFLGPIIGLIAVLTR